MVTYTCDICSKQFNRKSNYDYHIGNKKKPCRQITEKINQNLPNLPKLTKNGPKNLSNELTTECEYCNKGFSTIYSLKRHMDGRCKVKNDLDNENKLKDELYLKQIEEQSKKIEELSKKIEELSKKSKTSNINNNIVVNNNSNTTNNTNTNNINLVAHGSEDLSKYDTEKVLKFLCTYEIFDIIPDAVKDVYINDKKPENKNFRVTDISRNKSEYFDGVNWIVGKADEGILKIFENINDLFVEPFNNTNIRKTMAFINQNEEFQKRWKQINSSRNFCKNLYNDKDKDSIDNRNNILNQLKLLFYNFREQIINTN
jgi:hypothetical protein